MNEVTNEIFTCINDEIPDDIDQKLVDRPEDFVTYSSSLGLTGQAIQSCEIVIANNLHKEQKGYNPSTDNI